MLLVAITAAIGLKSLALGDNVDLMLPADAEVSRGMRFLRESQL